MFIKLRVWGCVCNCNLWQWEPIASPRHYHHEPPKVMHTMLQCQYESPGHNPSPPHTQCPSLFSPNLCQKTLEMDVFPLSQGLTCSALWNRKETCCQKMKHSRKLVVALIEAVNSHPMTLTLLNGTWHCSSGQERGGVGIQLPSLSLWPWRDNRQHRAATLSLKKQPVNYPQVSQRRQEAPDRR